MIIFNNNTSFKLAPDKNLLELATDNDIPLNHSCGGYGTCGTCQVIITNHLDLPPRNPIEQEMADSRGFNDNERLACQTSCNQQLNVETPKGS